MMKKQSKHREYCAVKRYNHCHFADDYNIVGSDYIGLVFGAGLTYFGLGRGLGLKACVLLTSLIKLVYFIV